MSPAKHVAAHHGHVVHHAASSAHDAVMAGIDVLLYFVAAVVGFVLLIWCVNRASRMRRDKAEQQAQDAQEERTRALAPWLQEPLPPIAMPVGLAFEAGELAYYSGSAVILGEHTQTRRVGGSAGPSFRVAKGVYFHTSAFASQPVRQTYTAVDDRGILTVTNMRVIFIGAKHSLAWPVSKILSLTPFTDGVQVNPENRSPVVFQTGNEVASIVLQRARQGSLTKSLSATL